jgi:hypothetical protein
VRYFQRPTLLRADGTNASRGEVWAALLKELNARAWFRPRSLAEQFPEDYQQLIQHHAKQNPVPLQTHQTQSQ